MKEKIISKACYLFLKLGFKSVTMDDIAADMCISKKTIYKYFGNKEILIEESTALVHKQINDAINDIIAQQYNAIEENFEIRKMFKEIFKVADTSPLYQLKKHYPEIHQKVMAVEINECTACFTQNLQKGIEQDLYRSGIDIEAFVKFYYSLIFTINENTISEKETLALELRALEYHTRAIATPKGILELEKHLHNPNT